MSRKVLVGGSLRKWDLVAGAALAVACPLAGLSFSNDLPPGSALIIYAVAAIAGTAVTVAWYRRYVPRRWAIDTGTGLELYDRSGRHRTATIPDELVGSVALARVPKYGMQGDKVARVVRRMRLRTLDDAGAVRVESLVTEVSPDEDDPLGEYIERVLNRLSAAAQAVLARGGTLPGDGWQLTASELTVNATSHPLRNLKAASVLDKHVCVWLNDDERPVVRLKEEGWNAWLLLALLGERIRTIPESDRPLDHLGRTLYERRSSRFEYVVAFGFMLFSAIMTMAFFADDEASPMRILMPIGGALGVVGTVIWILNLRKCVFRCHEGGVYRATLFKERRLKFKDAVAFTYAATRVYHNGVYSGTQVRFDLEPASGRDAEHVVYNANIRNADEMLETLREHIAGVIGSRMFEFVASGHRVTWTKSVAFHRDQLLFTTGGFVRAKTEQSVAIRSITNYRMNDGVLELLVAGSNTPLISISTHERNFFPGFACLGMLINETVEAR